MLGRLLGIESRVSVAECGAEKGGCVPSGSAIFKAVPKTASSFRVDLTRRLRCRLSRKLCVGGGVEYESSRCAVWGSMIER